MYFEDLSPYTYRLRGERKPNPTVLNVGWLAKESPYSKGGVAKRILDRVLALCIYDAVDRTMGFHFSPFVEPAMFGYQVEYKGKKMILGTAEIRVRGKNGKTYVAPDLIYHYMKDCGYLPPQEFLDAVDSLPPVVNPSDEEYAIYSTALLKIHRVEEEETIVFREETKALVLNPEKIEEPWMYENEAGGPLTDSELIKRDIFGGDRKRKMMSGENPRDSLRSEFPQAALETIDDFLEKNKNPAIIEPRLRLGTPQLVFEKEYERLAWGIQTVDEDGLCFEAITLAQKAISASLGWDLI
jgi:hypothetical protein